MLSYSYSFGGIGEIDFLVVDDGGDGPSMFQVNAAKIDLN